MRLLILSSEFPPGPGGIGTHAYQLAFHLQQMGWEILVLTSQDYASQVAIQQLNNRQAFKIVRFSSPAGFFSKIFYRKKVLLNQIQEWKPNLIMASGDRMVYLASWAIGKKIPWIAIEHGRTPSKAEQRIKKWALRKASGVICVSQYTRSQMLKMGVRPKTETVIPNGADDSHFKQLPAENANKFRTALHLEKAKILLTVGHVSERKGQDTVIRALPLVLKQMPAVHYLMAGLPTQKEEFQKLAMELGVGSYVHFLGPVTQETLVCAFNACDVFVMTSRHASNGSFEGYGIAAVEAALCGKPAIVSNNSGLIEAIMEGKTGLGIPENNEAAAAEAILTLLKDENLRRQMGEMAKSRASAEQTWKSRAKEYDQFFRILLR